MPNRLALLLGLTLALPSPVAAQGEAAATAVLIREAGATRAQTTLAGMGIRRGVRSVDGLRYLHPVDELEDQVQSEDLQFALARLDPLADQMLTGDTRDAAAQADEVIEVLENNLGMVRRSQLVDAYMIAAVSQCLIGNRRECQERFSAVVTFREGLEYDAVRYGDQTEEQFDRARSRTMMGPRGTLIVETEPAGAEVFIDGRSYGPSPARADGLLVGWHYVTAKELGFERIVTRAEVRRNEQTTETYRLAPGERSALLGDRAVNRVRADLGAERASPDLVSLFGAVPAATMGIVGVARPAAGSAVHVQLWLYHLVTHNLLATDEVTISADEAGTLRMQEQVAGMFGDVDLAGGLEAPEDDTVIAGPQPELYEQWWFWVAVIGGAALVGGAIAIGLELGGGNRLPPQPFARVGVDW